MRLAIEAEAPVPPSEANRQARLPRDHCHLCKTCVSLNFVLFPVMIMLASSQMSLHVLPEYCPRFIPAGNR